MLNKVAKIISFCFEPFTVSSVALIVVITNLDIVLELKIVWFLTAVGLAGVPALAVLFYEKKTGKIHDWFIRNRDERRDVQIAWFVGSVLFFIITVIFAAPRLLEALALTLLLLSLLITTATFYWKISVHMVGVSLFVLIFLLVYSSSFLPLALFIPLVGWARVKLGAHTLTQVSAGALVTILITYLVFSRFGLVTF